MPFLRWGFELEPIFASFVDIRIDLDMQEGSPMSDLVEQLHVYISESYALTSHPGRYINKQLQWLCRQFRVSLRFITE